MTCLSVWTTRAHGWKRYHSPWWNNPIRPRLPPQYKEHAHCTKKLVSAHTSLKEVYSTPCHQYWELAASTEMLRHIIPKIREQSQDRAMNISKNYRHDRNQTEAHIHEHVQGTASASSQKPKPENAKRGQEPTQIQQEMVVSCWTEDTRKPCVARHARAGLEFRVVETNQCKVLAHIKWECLAS